MFKALMQFSAAFPLKLTVSDGKDGQIQVVMIPSPPQTVKDAEAQNALAQPILLTGTPQELEDGFLDALASLAAARKSLVEQVEAAQLVLEQARKAVISKSHPNAHSVASRVVANEPSDDVEVDDDAASPTHAEAGQGRVVSSAPAQAGASEVALF